MNKIPITQDYIFEFSTQQSFINEYLRLIEENKDKLQFLSSKISEVATKPKFCLDIPHHHGLFNWVNDCFNKVAIEKFNKANLTICDAWLTKTNFGQVGINHSHGYSIFSGILYLQDSPTVTDFFPTDFFYKSYQEPRMVECIENKIKMEYQPKAGTLLIFPSYLKHRIGVSRSKETRYTLAFNTFFNGVISELHTSRLELDVKYKQGINK